MELEVTGEDSRAIQLYEKLDFQWEGRRCRAFSRGGAYVDLLVLGGVR